MPRISITWLRFRSLDVSHAIAGIDPLQPALWLTKCGAQFNRRIGEADRTARKCPACEALRK